MTDSDFLTETERDYFNARGESEPPKAENPQSEEPQNDAHEPILPELKAEDVQSEALFRAWDNAVDEARREHSDIDGALQFLEQARLKQLGILAAADARFADADFCQKQIEAELRDIVIASYRRGINPAQAAYAMAVAYGFGGDKAERNEEERGNAESLSAQRDNTEKMQQIESASRAARSLTSGGGREAGDPYLLETVAHMPEAEFAKWYAKNKGSFRQLFEG